MFRNLVPDTEASKEPVIKVKSSSEEIFVGNGYEKRETLLRASNVDYSIDGNPILKGVNVDIKNIVRPDMQQGQVIGFLGPSGVGKTMLFEILAGVRKPTSGEVLIHNNSKPDGSLEPVKIGQVGVVQQKYPLFLHKTVYGNLDVAAKKTYSDSKERKDKIMEMMQMFRLDKHLEHYPAELSGGQKQRVAIAQQLLCSDNFLLLDEPFSGLDIKMIDKVSELIQQITSINEYMTVIIVSHDIASTASISDTLWLMGRDFDENKQPIPGSRIKYTYDLIEMGLAWKKDIHQLPAFADLVRDVRTKFDEL